MLLQHGSKRGSRIATGPTLVVEGAKGVAITRRSCGGGRFGLGAPGLFVTVGKGCS
ncbi:hypothetical protein LINGRAPRIM_LOCUS689 [Linum grandiflorum]